MKIILLLAAVLLPVAGVMAQPDMPSEHARKTFEIFRTIIEVDTSKAMGNTPKVAQFLADELVEAGFPPSDVEVLRKNDLAALIVRYRGDGSSGEKPILFLGHMDVVEAYAKDWERPPFELTLDETNFYGRGTTDNKFGIAQLTATFIRLKQEGFVPTRDLILAFSGDEESGMITTRMLAYDRPDLAQAEFALNSDAGGGDLDRNGKAITYNIQAAEKTYATWDITVRNPGGHSSRPREDNAIYDLADAIGKIQEYQFPVRYSDMTLAYFRETGEQRGGELGDAMLQFANDPGDEVAAARLAKESSYIGTTRTTCVVTMLKAGHAENALPQSATATVNCRIFPGVSVADIERVLREAHEAGLEPPSEREWAERLGTTLEHLQDLLAHLKREDRMVRTPGDLWFEAAAVAALRERILAHFESHDRLDTPAYKALIGTTRRTAVPLMEYFDDEHLTARSGDSRVLRAK